MPAHPLLPASTGRARRGAGAHPTLPAAPEPWESQGRTKMTFLVIRALKNKVERGRWRLPALPSASPLRRAPRLRLRNLLVLPMNHRPCVCGQSRRALRHPAGPGAGPCPGASGSWQSRHIPHVKHFLLPFIIPERPRRCQEGRGRACWVLYWPPQHRRRTPGLKMV